MSIWSRAEQLCSSFATFLINENLQNMQFFAVVVYIHQPTTNNWAPAANLDHQVSIFAMSSWKPKQWPSVHTWPWDGWAELLMSQYGMDAYMPFIPYHRNLTRMHPGVALMCLSENNACLPTITKQGCSQLPNHSRTYSGPSELLLPSLRWFAVKQCHFKSLMNELKNYWAVWCTSSLFFGFPLQNYHGSHV